MNLIVPIGKVQFIFYSHSGELIKNVIIGEENFCRITVPPEIWFGFKGLSKMIVTYLTSQISSIIQMRLKENQLTNSHLYD